MMNAPDDNDNNNSNENNNNDTNTTKMEDIKRMFIRRKNMNRTMKNMLPRRHNYSNMNLHPASFYCPLTMNIMIDPVMDRCSHTFERNAILHWLDDNACCPISRKPLTMNDLRYNHPLAECIEKWKFQQIQQKQQQQYNQETEEEEKALQEQIHNHHQRQKHPSCFEIDKAKTKTSTTNYEDNSDDDDDDDQDDDIERGKMTTMRFQKKTRKIIAYHPVDDESNLNNDIQKKTSIIPAAATTEINTNNRNISYEQLPVCLLLLPQEKHLLEYVRGKEEVEQRRKRHQQRIRWIKSICLLLFVICIAIVTYRHYYSDDVIPSSTKNKEDSNNSGND